MRKYKTANTKPTIPLEIYRKASPEYHGVTIIINK